MCHKGRSAGLGTIVELLRLPPRDAAGVLIGDAMFVGPGAALANGKVVGGTFMKSTTQMPGYMAMVEFLSRYNSEEECEA